MRQYLILLLLCACSVRLHATILSTPDTGRVVILSERVGPNIDPAEREKFGLFESILIHLFGSTLSFRNAVVLQLPDSTFRVCFTLGWQNELPRDTLVTYSYEVLLRIAETIEYFEGIKSGAYLPGRYPSPLLSATGELIVPKAADSRVALQDHEILPLALPLAPAEGYSYPRYFPSLDLGIGLHTYAPDLSGLSKVFGKTPSLGISPLVTGIAELAIAEAFAIQIEGGLSMRKGKAYQGALGGAYYIPLGSSGEVHAFLGAAILICSLGAEQSGIRVEGGGAGFSGTAGVEIMLGTTAATDIYAGFCSLPEVATSFNDWVSPTQRTSVPASIKLSSLVFGLRIKSIQ
jgi:hypothetical protein